MQSCVNNANWCRPNDDHNNHSKKRKRRRKENAVHENNNDEDDERISKNTTRHISECVRLRLLGTAILVLFAKVDNIRWQMDDGGCIVDAWLAKNVSMTSLNFMHAPNLERACLKCLCSSAACHGRAISQAYEIEMEAEWDETGKVKTWRKFFRRSK